MSPQRAIKFQPQVGVGILVVRTHHGKQQVLLHRRQKVTSGSGYWGSGGGYLDYGESLEQAALRELREEAGPDLKVRDLSFLGVCNFTDFEPYHSVDISFVAEWVSGNASSDQSGEAVEWAWFDRENLPSPLFPVVKRYLAALGDGIAFLDSPNVST